MKYLPLLWASLRRRPLLPLLCFASMTIALLLAGLTLSIAALLPHAGASGGTLDLAASGIAGLGVAMILFLTANATAQSVRARMGDFAVLKALGFSNVRIAILVWTETAIPCLAGAAVALILVASLSSLAAHFLFKRAAPPLPVGTTLALALLIPFAAVTLPVLRIARLDVATLLARR